MRERLSMFLAMKTSNTWGIGSFQLRKKSQLVAKRRAFEESRDWDDQTEHVATWDLLVPPMHDSLWNTWRRWDLDYSKGLWELFRLDKTPSCVPLTTVCRMLVSMAYKTDYQCRHCNLTLWLSKLKISWRRCETYVAQLEERQVLFIGRSVEKHITHTWSHNAYGDLGGVGFDIIQNKFVISHVCSSTAI